jgi:signal transduction histidine kinase
MRLSPAGIAAVLADSGLIWIVLTCLALALRRPYPVLAVAALVSTIVMPPPIWLSLLAWSYVLYVAAALRLPVALGALLAGLGQMLVSYGVRDMVAPALAVVIVWTIGFAVGRHRDYERQLRHAEVADERLRIARELHDVVAHSISVITVQAGFGHLVIDKQPAKARDALAAIETTGRETLIEMRRLLGVLRDDDQPSRTPAPGLATLDRLLEQTAQAGVRVELTTIGDPWLLPAGIDLSAYRIVQEALTNVVKHAHSATCVLVIRYGTGDVTIEVTDHGRGGPMGSGHGITGMRERVRLYGGEFNAEPLPGGGFRVTARLCA